MSLTLRQSHKKTKENPRTYYKFRKANWDIIKTDLDQILIEIRRAYDNNANVETLWTKFKNSLQDTIAKNIPSGTAKKRTRLPWINNSLLKELKKKKRLYRKAKKSNNWIRYKTHQKFCKRELRKAEWKFINSTIEDGLKENNTKPFWNFIKARRRDNIGVSPLKDGGKLFSDSATKAKILLTQFKSVFTIDDGKQLPNMPNSYPSCPPIQITVPGVAKLLRNLKTGKAPGPDCLPNIVLKNCADHIAPILSLIYQRSLDSGELPSDWLSANISAAFKKGNRHLPENYRPISLTSIPCKILEHIICSHLHKHFDNHKILTNLNHGFRSGFSCETQLLTTADDLLQSFDRNRQVDVAILDFSKAFDTVPHQKLLHKLSTYGIRDSTLSWLTCFLTKRSMRVVLEGSASESTSVDSGVPQGTVLGPLLFLSHFNDLPNSVSSKVRLFADDCLLYREINSIQDHISLQNDLKQLKFWALTWGMRFNASKCYILSINRVADKKSLFHYQLNSTILKHVTDNPYLGILFSDDLTWRNHIAKSTKKANSTLGFLKRNLHNCPRKCKKAAYVSLIRSVLEYGATLWDPYLKKDINQLEQVQRKALRFMYNDYKNYTPGSIDKLQKKSQLPSLQDRRKAIRLTFMYKVVEGLVPAMPTSTFILFNKPGRQIRVRKDTNFITKNAINNYVRNNNRSIKIPDSKTEQYRHSFFVQTAVDWNQLPDQVVQSKSLDTFKKQLEKNLQLD